MDYGSHDKVYNRVYRWEPPGKTNGIPRGIPGLHNEGYIRTLIHIMYLVLRVQSSILLGLPVITIRLPTLLTSLSIGRNA